MFLSADYSGEDLVPKFGAGEQWKKVFGPVLIYLNSSFDTNFDPLQLWGDAKTQVNFLINHFNYVSDSKSRLKKKKN